MTTASSTPSLTIVEEDTPRNDVEKGAPGRGTGVWRGKVGPGLDHTAGAKTNVWR